MITDLRQQFGDRYTVRDDGTNDAARGERVWCQEIPGRLGTIYPHGRNGALAVCVRSAWAARRLAAMGLKAIQRGEDETTFVFDPRLLDQVAALAGSKRRRQLSPEARERATGRLRALAATRAEGLSPDKKGGSGA